MAPGGDSIELLAPVAAPSRLVARAAHTIGEVRAAAKRRSGAATQQDSRDSGHAGAGQTVEMHA